MTTATITAVAVPVTTVAEASKVQTYRLPTEAIKAYHDTTYREYILGVAGVDVLNVDDVECEQGIDVQLLSFVQDTGRLPHTAEEIDAYSGSQQDWDTYLATHGVFGKVAPLPTADPVVNDRVETVSAAAIAAVEAAMPAVDVEALDEEYTTTVKQIVRVLTSTSEANQRLSVLFYHAVQTRMSGNAARKHVIRRKECIQQLYAATWDYVDGTDDIATFVKHGATLTHMFGATVERPFVAKDGACYEKLGKERKPMPWTTITALSPLVIKDGSDVVETWRIAEHVKADALELVQAIAKDGLPRTTVQNAVAELMAQHHKAIVAINPANQAAKQEAARWEKKIERTVEKDAVGAIVTPPVTPAATAVAVPTEAVEAEESADETTAEPVGNLIKPVVAAPTPEQRANATPEDRATDMHEFLTEDGYDVATQTLVALMELVKDDDGFEQGVRSAAVAFLLHRSKSAKPAAAVA